MNELPPSAGPEMSPEDEVFLRLHQVFDRYFPEDKIWAEVEVMTTEEALDFAYGQLIECGEDPNSILKEFGIIEGEDGEV